MFGVSYNSRMVLAANQLIMQKPICLARVGLVQDVGYVVVSCASAGRELNNLFTTGACWETAGGSASETKQMPLVRGASFSNIFPFNKFLFSVQ